MKQPKYLGIYSAPPRMSRISLAIFPFLLLVVVYMIASDIRLEINPKDKLMPSFIQMAQAFWGLATNEDKRSGDILLWVDTWASLSRLIIGLSAAAITGLLLGVNMAIFPLFRSLSTSIISFLTVIPPLTLLPILFIVFGIGEVSKIVLIYIGTVFVITRDIFMATSAIPRELIVKGSTLGACNLQIVYQLVIPMMIPRLLSVVRLSLGAAWLFLIAAEAISSTEGLGYRIFLFRRYMAMDHILPLVIWITVIGYGLDYGLKVLIQKLYPWYNQEK